MTYAVPKAVKSTLVTEFADGSTITYEVNVPHLVSDQTVPADHYEFSRAGLSLTTTPYGSPEIVLSNFDNTKPPYEAYVMKYEPGPAKFEVGDFVKFTSPAAAKRYGFNARTLFRVSRVHLRTTDPVSPSAGWIYEMERRDRGVAQAFSGDAVGHLRKSVHTSWPLRKGDFVQMAYDASAIRKLLRKVTEGDAHSGRAAWDGINPAWWHEDEQGAVGWDHQSSMTRVEVHVTKKVKWTKKIDVPGFEGR